jgi:2-iminobutanoate/2-iminopropanoate deaminase
MKLLYLVVAALCFSGVLVCSLQAQQQRQASQAKPGATQPAPSVEYLAGTRSGSAPLSEAVRVGSMLYLSGQLGVDASGTLASGGIKGETKQVMENIRNTLEKNNSGMDRVVKCTVMLTDIADRSAMNEVYVTFFSKDRLPARSAFGTTGLALGAKVEIECLATVK